MPFASTAPLRYPSAIAIAYKLITNALRSGAARDSKIVSHDTQMPTLAAPSKKRSTPTLAYSV